MTISRCELCEAVTRVWLYKTSIVIGELRRMISYKCCNKCIDLIRTSFGFPHLPMVEMKKLKIVEDVEPVSRDQGVAFCSVSQLTSRKCIGCRKNDATTVVSGPASDATRWECHVCDECKEVLVKLREGDDLYDSQNLPTSKNTVEQATDCIRYTLRKHHLDEQMLQSTDW
jgi:hypothetical protein